MAGAQSARQQNSAEWSVAADDPKSTEDRILSTAAYLFCRQGFAATGVDQIAAESGAAKSTLYSKFGSKEQLIESALEAEGAAWRRWVFGQLAATGGSPRDQVHALFEILKRWFEHPDFYGCAFINAVSEASPGDTRVRAIADRHKSHLVRWLRALALELDADPDEFTRSMIILIDGAIVAAQATGQSFFAEQAMTMADLYLDGMNAQSA